MLFAYGVLCALIIVMSGLAWIWQGGGVGVAVLYGGFATMANIGLLVWRWRRGRYDYHCDGGRHLRQFHRSMMERFFVVGAILAAGIVGLSLEPLPMLVGFIVGQVAWMISASALKTD